MRRWLPDFLSGVGIASVFLHLAAPAQGADLRVVIVGVGAAGGTLVAGLYDKPENYELAVRKTAQILVNDPKRIAGVSLRAVAGSQTVVFADLSPGLYAVIVVHDENDDGRFNKAILGVPLEPYGISNNPRTLVSPPDFAQAAVRIGEGDETIRITLIAPNAALSGSAR